MPELKTIKVTGKGKLKLEFDSDNELLGKVLYALGGSDIRPEFGISYL
jgi:hypothetical protein